MLISRAAVLALAVVAPALAGCLGGGDDAAPSPASSAPPAPVPSVNGASPNATASGPTAPTGAFDVERDGSRATVYPYVIPGQKARPARALDFAGEYAPEDCTTILASDVVGDRFRYHDLTGDLEAGDAVVLNVTFTYSNTDQNFADLHLSTGVPGQSYYFSESVGDRRGEIVQSFEYQFSYAGGPDAWAFVGVDCWWAANVQTISYALTVRLTFGEGVIPAGSPHLVRVDANVTELRVTGAPAAPGVVVTGHYRVFDPADRLLGEFALNSDEAFDAVRAPTPGDYVIIVDHSENGMLALGADARPADPEVRILDVAWQPTTDLVTTAPGPVDETVTVEIPRVPLRISPWVRPAEGGAALGKKITIDIDGPKGRVWHRQLPTYVGADLSRLGRTGTVLPGPDPWESTYDHHALALGTHTVAIRADAFQGEVYHGWVTYLRPGEDAPPEAVVNAGGSSAERARAPADLAVPALAVAAGNR